MNKQQKQTKAQRHRQQYDSYQGKGGWGVVIGKMCQTYGDRRFDFGWWAHNTISR